MVNHQIQAQLIDMVFGPGVSPDDIIGCAERARMTPQAYIGECLRVAIEQGARNVEAGALVLEDENAQHTICDFAGVVDG